MAQNQCFLLRNLERIVGGVALDVSYDPQTGEKAPNQNPQAGTFTKLYRGKKIQSQKKVAAANHIMFPPGTLEECFSSLQLKNQAMALGGKKVMSGPDRDLSWLQGVRLMLHSGGSWCKWLPSPLAAAVLQHHWPQWSSLLTHFWFFL